ncbi:hypothetical protein F4860DRAFT_516485 [Xylaria cubensis]|nr:hypothetical protein F4860DRAFT_516485 [Xylaria cubensis]
MHFSKATTLLLTSLNLAAAGVVSRDTDVKEARYKIGDNVYSNIPPKTGVVAYKIGDNVWSSVPPANGTADQSTVPVTKRDTFYPTLDELKANRTLAVEWMSAHSPSDVTVNANELDIAARWPRWSDTLARCIVAMSSCYYMVAYDQSRTTAEKISFCFSNAYGYGYCQQSPTTQAYRRQFGGDFAPEDAVLTAMEQLYIDYNGGQ